MTLAKVVGLCFKTQTHDVYNRSVNSNISVMAVVSPFGVEIFQLRNDSSKDVITKLCAANKCPI
jgi:hypothetical protein